MDKEVDVDDLRRAAFSSHRAIAVRALQTIASRLPSSSSSSSSSASSAFPPALVGPATDILWDALLSTSSSSSSSSSTTTTSSFLSSAASSLLLRAVAQGAIPWPQSLDRILDRLGAIPAPCLPHCVALLVGLLTLNAIAAAAAADDAATARTKPATSTAARDLDRLYGLRFPRVHPFIRLAETRPDAWPLLLAQLRSVLVSGSLPGESAAVPRARFLTQARPFFPIPAAAAAADVLALLRDCRSAVLRAVGPADPFPLAAADLVRSVFRDLPMALLRGGGGGAAGMLAEVVDAGRDGPPEGRRAAVMAVLAAACDAARVGEAAGQWIDAAHALAVLEEEKAGKEQDAPRRLAPGFAGDAAACAAVLLACCFLVLRCTDYDGDRAAELMHAVVAATRRDPVLRPLHRCCIVPLVQLAGGEGRPRAVRTAAACLKMLEPDLTHAADRDGIDLDADRVLVLEGDGNLRLLLALGQSLLSQQSATTLPIATLIASRDPAHVLTALSFFLFHPHERVRLDALAGAVFWLGLGQAAQLQSALVILPVLLMVLRNDPSARVKNHVLATVLPSLADLKDPFVTSRLIRIGSSLAAAASDFKEPLPLSAAGLRLLGDLWKRQPRVWVDVKAALSRKTAELNRMEHGSTRDAWEVGILSVLRDVCQTKPRECGEEVLLFTSSLLTGTNLCVTAVALAVRTINSALRVQVQNPRAVWFAFLASVAKAVPQEVAFRAVWSAFGEYFKTAAERDDGTEVNMSFKQELLSECILPLSRSDHAALQAIGYSSLAAFPPPEIYQHLPEPKLFVAGTVLDARFGDLLPGGAEHPSALLSSLVRHEVASMRRAVFKGLASDNARSQGVVRDVESDKLEKLLESVASDVRTLAESGKVSPGNRPGCAAANLFLSARLGKGQQETAYGGVLGKLPFFKHLVNCLRDVSMSDNLLTRMTAVSAWSCFWRSHLIDFAKDEKVISDLLQDLVKKRMAETQSSPLVTNILFSLAGLFTACAKVSFIGRHAENLIDLLVDLSNGTTKTMPWQDTRTDDVLSAILICLAHSACALNPTEDARKTKVLSALQLCSSSKSEPVLFGVGYGYGTLLAYLLQHSPNSPMVPPIVAWLSDNLYGSGETNLGAAMGLSFSLSGAIEVDEELGATLHGMVESSVSFVTDWNVLGLSSAAKIMSHCWILSKALASRWMADRPDVCEQVLLACGKSLKNKEHQNWHAICLHIRSETRAALQESGQSESNKETAHAELTSDLEALSSGKTPIAHRANLILGIVPSLQMGSLDNLSDENARVLRNSLATLHEHLLGPEPKLSRASGWALGQIYESLYAEDRIRTAAGGGDAAEVLAKDPNDYSRLQVGASFLRAAFEALGALSPDQLLRSDPLVLLQALSGAGVQLPYVNW
ncbi:hypothetical protein DFJ73DRAFT_794120, partial [Zopfochytrium polystomum]